MMSLQSGTLLLILASAVSSLALAASDAHISPHAKFRPVGMADVTWTAGLWADRYRLCRDTMTPTVEMALRHPDNAARLDNFLALAKGENAKHLGKDWGDGDC